MQIKILIEKHQVTRVVFGASIFVIIYSLELATNSFEISIQKFVKKKLIEIAVFYLNYLASKFLSVKRRETHNDQGKTANIISRELVVGLKIISGTGIFIFGEQ